MLRASCCPPVPAEYPGEVEDHVDGEGARDRGGGDGWVEVDPGDAFGAGEQSQFCFIMTCFLV
jgi:hypothetical protein